MLAADVHSAVSPKGTDAEEGAGLLSLAETIGNMGHWHWQVETDTMTWSPQVFSIFDENPSFFNPSLSHFVDSFHAADRQRVAAYLSKATADAVSFEFDARIVTRTSALKNIIVKGQAEFDQSGKASALVGVITDVTAAFKTLQAVRDQKDMLDLAAQVSGLGHWVWDPEQASLAFCSDHLCCMFDTQLEKLLSGISHPSEFSRFVHEDDRRVYVNTLSSSIVAARPYDLEYRCAPSIGVRFYREIGQPVVDKAGNLRRYITTVQDITAAKIRETELDKARQELQQSVKAKDQLFSIIGHDLKSPFNNIIGFASLLSSEDVKLPPEKVKEYGALIVEAAQNTNALLDNLLAWAAVESADLPFRCTKFELESAVEESIRPLQLLARAKGVEIRHALEHMQVNADRHMVQTVFRNLINNAIKFCEAGNQIEISAQIEKDAPEHVHITVTDDGVGMDADKVEAFLQSRKLSTTLGTSGETGYGLGLRLCLNLVRRHSGDLWVESNPGSGCKFHFTLPTG
ncbi:MAG: ATP-binding protein [Rhodospirillaceae bacterium]